MAIGTARPGSSPSNPYRLMFVPSGLLKSSSSEDNTESVSELSDTRDPPIGDFDSEPMDTTSLKLKVEKTSRLSTCFSYRIEEDCKVRVVEANCLIGSYEKSNISGYGFHWKHVMNYGSKANKIIFNFSCVK